MRLKAKGWFCRGLGGIAGLALAGCTAQGHDGYPVLAPFGAQVAEPPVETTDTGLAARIAALKARAAAMQHAPVLSAADQAALGR